MGDVKCRACLADNQEEVEEVCLQVKDASMPGFENGTISWAEAAKRLNWSNGNSLKIHMRKHYISTAQEMDQINRDFLLTLKKPVIEALATEMQYQPTLLQPNYIIAIRSLMDIEKTKPSQQYLISALKAIQEITGMSLENQMLLSYASNQFAEANDIPALDEVVDMEEDE